ncbi:haloacid dehalogenase type II [Metabacillus iocasae]|uniref:2-haloacid dehalogenase n=1 Tax=Priestia iocasae TaxID=2291674 RepID=A0ABS2QSG6_9BACI|nr:haloacid dehalogenase type II [Metabacillus iocasae]MBM7702399.1 2-haloacid dehalogenase [Metabacillus iocasae]
MKPKAIIFDAYGTLFDVHSVVKKCNEYYPDIGQRISVLWRTKQIEYAMQHQLMGRYVDFYELTKKALRYAVEACEAAMSEETEQELMNAYLQLNVYDEVKEVLTYLKEKGYTLAIFTNGPKHMIEPLVRYHRMQHLFQDVISVDEIKQYKPTMASYHYAKNKLNIEREEVLFLSSNTWDIAGAKNYGFSTAWVNRQHNVAEHLELAPNVVIQSLADLVKK